VRLRSSVESPTTNSVSRRTDALLEIIFPPACVACGTVTPSSTAFCLGCELELERIPERHCPNCAEPGDFESDLCPRCELRPPPFSRVFAPFLHHGPIARAIHQFKYEDHPELAPVLAALVIREAQDFLAMAPKIVCAIPLHRKRRWRRKYDQAQLLSYEIAQRTQRRHAECLRRSRDTRRQVGLTEAQRDQNVAGSFEPLGNFAGESLLLIDDVFTTGATARSAALALRGAGARDTQVLAIARAFTQT
jgi:ComF family protein